MCMAWRRLNASRRAGLRGLWRKGLYLPRPEKRTRCPRTRSRLLKRLPVDPKIAKGGADGAEFQIAPAPVRQRRHPLRFRMDPGAVGTTARSWDFDATQRLQ